MEAIRDLFNIPNAGQVTSVTVRLLAAAALGGVVGLERQVKGKAAGLRTHMLVALGTALFTIAPMEAGMPMADVSRILQGVAAGVGFIGAGTILKLADQEQIKGLTTAASIWLTAAIGIATGVGSLWISVLGTVIAVTILAVLSHLESRTQ